MKFWMTVTTAGIALTYAAVATAQSSSTMSVKQDNWQVKGLSAPAEIAIDHWGIPHIYAATQRDAYFLQGYNAARDRLWQIDLWRKRGLGLLAKSFGPAYVAQDRAARLFLYQGDMNAEWNAYAPDTRTVLEAFTAGINAYVAEVKAGAKPMPLEFGVTRSEPDTWRPEDVLRIRTHTLVSNVTSEVRRARIACAGGVDADELRTRLEPEGHKRVVPAGVDPCDVPADVLSDYVLATQQVSFTKSAEPQRASIDPDVELASLHEAQRQEGSNNWVIAPSKTETGRPILANDPHRQLGVPALRYLVGLNAPGLSVIGASEPALPGISIGHNEDIAFGMTIFAMDQEDLYIYDVNPDDPNAYRYNGNWEKMRIQRQTIEVKGEAPREVELKFTRHGPVIKDDAGKKKAFAMRSVWWEVGGAGYFGATRLANAKTWDDFRAASNAWGAPPLNLVYADTKGNVGWSAVGRTPIRKNWDGLLPVPGDGRYEWQGFMAKDMLPSALNPKEGFFATANEYNLPKGYPAEERKISFEWTHRSRIDRIKEVLAGKAKHTLHDSMQLQGDAVSPQARRFVKVLQTVNVPDNNADLAKALNLLKGWDGKESVDSIAATIYEVWTDRHLGKAVVQKVTPAGARDLVGNGAIEPVLVYLEKPDKRLGADPTAARSAVIQESLTAALAEIRTLLGPDMNTWAWGRLHVAKWEPPIAPLLDPQTRAQMTVGPLAAAGSGSTPRAQTYRSDFTVSSGASIRLVMDVGAWDNSMAINTPGQSSDPNSAHYRDLFPLWVEGRYVPLAFSRPAVDRVTSHLIRLTPAGG